MVGEVQGNQDNFLCLKLKHFPFISLICLQVCKTTPHIRDTNHLFLELPLLEDRLEKYINEMSVAGSWSQNAVQTTNSWLKEGLKPRCITRDLKWGVPVPHERFRDKVRRSQFILKLASSM